MGYPFAKYRYIVEIEGLQAGGFSEVSGFDASIDVIEYREGNLAGMTPMKLSGLRKYGNITLKQGLTDSMIMYKWMEDAVKGNVVRKTVTISLLSEADMKTPIATWQVINAWPTKYTAPDFNATSSEVAIETMELAHEGLTRTL